MDLRINNEGLDFNKVIKDYMKKILKFIKQRVLQSTVVTSLS